MLGFDLELYILVMTGTLLVGKSYIHLRIHLLEVNLVHSSSKAELQFVSQAF